MALRDFLFEEFSDRDYAVTAVVDGKDAIEKILLSEFVLILADVKMPRLGGIELLAHVRRCFPQIRVILMTAFGKPSHEGRRWRRGLRFACIFKPIVPKEWPDAEEVA